MSVAHMPPLMDVPETSTKALWGTCLDRGFVCFGSLGMMVESHCCVIDWAVRASKDSGRYCPVSVGMVLSGPVSRYLSTDPANSTRSVASSLIRDVVVVSSNADMLRVLTGSSRGDATTPIESVEMDG